jgi:hypothetical protein
LRQQRRGSLPPTGLQLTAGSLMEISMRTSKRRVDRKNSRDAIASFFAGC